MKVVNVKQAYNLSYIGRNNDIWRDMMKELDGEEAVLFDFRNVSLQEPWKNEQFKIFITDNRVHMKVYTAEEIKNTLDALLLLSNSNPGRIENENIVVKSVLSTKDKTRKMIETRLKGAIILEDEGKIVRFPINKLFSQIGDYLTIEGIKCAIQSTVEENDKIETVIVDFGPMSIQTDVFEKISNMDEELGLNNIEIELESQNDQILGYIDILRCIKGAKDLTDTDKMERFSNMFKPGDVGMLTVFKETRKTDLVGRMGNGEALYCRPAIFDGFERSNGTIYLLFRSFPKKFFYTRNHYYLDNDGERLSGLNPLKQKFVISEIGLQREYTGTKGHFNAPIQYDPKDNISTYRSGTTEVVRVTLPGYIKMVLDDHKYNYNRSRLLNDIITTEKYLAQFKK